MMDPLTFWNNFIGTQRLSRAEAIHSMTHMEFAAWIGNIEALKFYFELKLEELRPYALEKAAKYAFLKFSLDEDIIVFFYENVEPCTWNILLHDNFQAIFHCLLSSWNYRYLCLKFFKDVRSSLDIKTYRSLLSRIGFTWYQSRFEYYDVIQIIQSIWLDTPEDFKEDHDVSFVIIPEIILIKCDFGVLPYFIACYNQEKQKEILGLILFGLITSSNQHLIRHVFEYVEPLGFYFLDCKFFLTKKLLKHFLLTEARKSYSKSYENLKKIKEFIREYGADEVVSFEDLFYDRDFIVELFVQMSQKKDMDMFLEWGLKNENKIEDFIQELVKDGLVNDIYDRRLLENENVETAYEIFNMLALTKKEIAEIEQSVSDNPHVITSVLINLLETDQITHTKDYMTRCFPNYIKQKLFMENFLLDESGYGLRAIYEMFLRMGNLLVNKSQELREPWDLFDYLSTIRNSWLVEYGLVSRFELVLQEKGHPILNPFKLRIKDQFTEQIKQSRAVVNALYRCFRAILQKNFGRFYFEIFDNLSLFDLSEMMMDEVDINVPSVL